MNLSNVNIENILYDVSKTVHESHNLKTLFKNLHKAIKRSLDIDNFYVALLNRELDLLTYPYHHDIKDSPPKEKFSSSKGLTHYAIKKEKGLIIDRSKYDELINKGKVAIIGSPAEYWLGVPIKDFSGLVIGLISIQTYKKGIKLNKEHLKMISFVSEQITLAIERFQHLKEVKHLTYYDPLTELPNKSLFFKEGSEMISNIDKGFFSACLFLDLDDFMMISDTYGESVSNRIIQDISYNLTKIVTSKNKVYYWGADKFTIILNENKKIDEIKKKIVSIQRIISNKINIDDETFSITCSIGVSISPLHGTNIRDLCRDADIAMHQAKEKGKNKVQFFEEYMKDVIITNYGIDKSLKEAISHKHWEIYYQPQIDLNYNEIIGFEALIRWNHPREGIIMPSQFIPTAEMNNYIFDIGKFVLKEVCKQTNEWNQGLSRKMMASVNLSAKEFQKKGLIELIDSTLEETGFESSNLIIEITENTFLSDTSYQLKQIKDRGIKISIDDFGTGYSSLSYLYEYPIDCIKIDKSFVRNIHKDKQKKILSNSIINLANNLNLDIVTEGIEKEKELAFFKSKNCKKFQGYFFSKPLPKEDFEKLIFK